MTEPRTLDQITDAMNEEFDRGARLALHWADNAGIDPSPFSRTGSHPVQELVGGFTMDNKTVDPRTRARLLVKHADTGTAWARDTLQDEALTVEFAGIATRGRAFAADIEAHHTEACDALVNEHKLRLRLATPSLFDAPAPLTREELEARTARVGEIADAYAHFYRQSGTRPPVRRFDIETAVEALNDHLSDREGRYAEHRAQFFMTYPTLETDTPEVTDPETLTTYAEWHELNWERISLEYAERSHAEEGERLRERRARLIAEGKIRETTD